MNKDTVIGLVGTLILVLAMVGVFRYEATQGGGASYQVAFATTTAPAREVTGATAVGQSSTTSTAIPTGNLTKVEWALTWTATQGTADTLSVRITSPWGDGRNATASDGRIVLTWDNLSRPPPDFRLLGASQTEVEQKVARDYGNASAAGNWSVTVRFEKAEVTTPAGPLPVAVDQQVSWRLVPTVTSYAATVRQG